MKHLIPVLSFLALPGAASAQINIDFSSGVPVVRANVGGVPLAVSIGSRGKIDLRIDDSRTASAVLSTADSYVGTKYVWGGETPSGFDCSGFVQYVFRRHGVELPRTSRQQAKVGQSVPATRGALEVGDLMLFASNGSRIDHIAIYAGNGEIIHSSSSGGGVGYDNLSSKRGGWFLSHHVATRRVLEDGQSLVGPLTAALRAFVGYDPPDRAPRR